MKGYFGLNYLDEFLSLTFLSDNGALRALGPVSITFVTDIMPWFYIASSNLLVLPCCSVISKHCSIYLEKKKEITNEDDGFVREKKMR